MSWFGVVYISFGTLYILCCILDSNDIKDAMLASGMFVNEYKDLLSFLDTLETKEVDLEKEIEKVKKMYNCLELKEETIIDFCAKHFFELGLKAQKGE